MNILIYGAGVLGSRYGAALSKTANKVTILARGERAAFLRKNGIVLEEVSTGTQNITPVYVTEELKPEDEYDLVIVLMRSNQAEAILPILEANKNIPVYLFLGNNVTRTENYIKALGHERVLTVLPVQREPARDRSFTILTAAKKTRELLMLVNWMAASRPAWSRFKMLSAKPSSHWKSRPRWTPG